MTIISSKPTITRKELESVLDCLIEEKLYTGSPVKIFESKFSEVTGVKYSLATNSLTSAYHLAFMALGIGAEDEVIIPSYFDIAPLSALKLTGGKAVLVDIEDGLLTPSVKQIKSKVSSNTKAIVLGHILGFPVKKDELQDLKIPVIEDISHVIGAEYNDETPVWKAGTIFVASFSPSMIITTGNGGALATNNSKLHSTMKELRGISNGKQISYDYHMTDFQGAMGVSQLSKLRHLTARRREIAKIYSDALMHTPHKSLQLFNETCVYQSFPVIFDSPKDKVQRYWRKNRVEIYHPIENPLHNYLDEKGLDYPNSRRLASKLYSMPIYPTLTKKEIERIALLLAKFI